MRPVRSPWRIWKSAWLFSTGNTSGYRVFITPLICAFVSCTQVSCLREGAVINIQTIYNRIFNVTHLWWIMRVFNVFKKTIMLISLSLIWIDVILKKNVQINDEPSFCLSGAFFLPYFVFLFIVGIPVFLIEVSLGQFTSEGTLTCWSYAPMFRGKDHCYSLHEHRINDMKNNFKYFSSLSGIWKNLC